MHVTYQIQLVLVHAQIITTLILAITIWMVEAKHAHIKIVAYGAEIKELWNNFFIAYSILQFYILLIRSESHLLMGIVYVGNGCEWLAFFLKIYSWCPDDPLNEISNEVLLLITREKRAY
ncbi:15260_t:CDS:2 [Funneliformis mosseae]|uniref:15260_t:CDS:1 n=1 Tax=Funneliformis mosseae TaxID=27381 RepID=A0A9N9D3S3_FUNMO|nr:15260_t:CDS:2 [Funneliformis mosseae]